MSGLTSRAAILRGPGQLSVEELKVPSAADDDGVMKVEATGVCGTDIAAYQGVNPFYELPCALGHEMVGRVVDIGETAARRWNVASGDRIVVEEYLPCGRCRSCLAGAYQMCVVPRYGGRSVHKESGLYGGYADYLYLHPQAMVHRVEGTVHSELVQLYVPISNGLDWTANIGGVRPGSRVVIIGPGPHGLSCVVGAKESGAEQIILIGRQADAPRLAVGSQLGATDVLGEDGQQDVVDAVSQLTGGLMAETVINCADSAAAMATATQVVGDRGTIVQVGLAKTAGADMSATVAALTEKVLTIRGVRGRPTRMVPPALRLIESGRYPLQLLCTQTFDVEDTEAALTAVASDASAIRSVVVPA